MVIVPTHEELVVILREYILEPFVIELALGFVGVQEFEDGRIFH